MFEIKYSYSGNNHPDVINADETALRYNHFLGNLTLKKGNDSIVLDWGWIPLVDFALCLQVISKTLLQKAIGEEEFEFTESDAKIIFKKNGDVIRVSASSSNGVLEMGCEDFQNAANKFYKDIILNALNENQMLRSNKKFVEYIKEAEKI